MKKAGKKLTISSYVLSWVLILFLGLLSWWVYYVGDVNSRAVLGLTKVGVFRVGIFCGIMWTGCIVLFYQLLIPVYKWVYNKCKKTPCSFLNILMKEEGNV